MDATAGPQRLADGDALAAFVEDHDLALVQLHTAGCPKCRAMEPVLSNVARATTAAVGLVDLGDDPGLVERFDVRSVPTLVRFADGEAIATTADGSQGTEAVVAFPERNAPGRVETVAER